MPISDIHDEFAVLLCPIHPLMTIVKPNVSQAWAFDDASFLLSLFAMPNNVLVL